MEQSKSYIDEVGDTIWYLPSKGKSYWHRLDGPAVEYLHGSKKWYKDNKIHRIDGPACEYIDGTRSWWIDGFMLNNRKVEAWLKENDIDLKTPEGQMAFKLRWM